MLENFVESVSLHVHFFNVVYDFQATLKSLWRFIFYYQSTTIIFYKIIIKSF